jgi:fructose-1,6-bisphosphatase/inositol monophosphatase family enzyme
MKEAGLVAAPPDPVPPDPMPPAPLAPDPLAPDLLAQVIRAVETAGAMVVSEFHRPGGPRFSDPVTAPVDHEIELFLRARLTALCPGRFVGEEAGVLEAPDTGFCWVVDPHDGTRAFLEGRRGSAVSVALLRAGQPVLGVVFAPLSPDRGPDLIAWAAGAELTRNGRPVGNDLRRRHLGDGDVVFLNHGAWQRPVWHATAVAPGRFMPLPSIAYRLARVAVGDGVATLTLRPVNALDVVAGHALLAAAGGVLIAEDGVPVTYTAHGESRPSACFGGAPQAVATLMGRVWRGSTEPRREQRTSLAWPRLVPEPVLDRAIGALLGLLIGDAGGAAGSPAGRADDGRLAGQPGPQGEAALATARALLAGAPLPPGDGLARLVPLAIAAAGPGAAGQAATAPAATAPAATDPGATDPAATAAAAIRDAARTAQNPQRAAAFARAIATGLAGADEAEVLRVAGGLPADAALAGALRGVAGGRHTLDPRAALAVLTCRPDAALGVAAPRPDEYWPDDVTELAEALLRLALRETA